MNTEYLPYTCVKCGASAIPSVSCAETIVVTHTCQNAACGHVQVTKFSSDNSYNPFAPAKPDKRLGMVGKLAVLRFGKMREVAAIIYERKNRYGDVYYHFAIWNEDRQAFFSLKSSSYTLLEIKDNPVPLNEMQLSMGRYIRYTRNAARFENIRRQFAIPFAISRMHAVPQNTIWASERFGTETQYEYLIEDANEAKATKAKMLRDKYLMLANTALALTGIVPQGKG